MLYKNIELIPRRVSNHSYAQLNIYVEQSFHRAQRIPLLPLVASIHLFISLNAPPLIMCKGMITCHSLLSHKINGYCFPKESNHETGQWCIDKKVRAWLRGLVTQILHSSTQIISNESVYGINSVMCFTLLYLPNILRRTHNQNIDWIQIFSCHVT